MLRQDLAFLVVGAFVCLVAEESARLGLGASLASVVRRIAAGARAVALLVALLCFPVVLGSRDYVSGALGLVLPGGTANPVSHVGLLRAAATGVVLMCGAIVAWIGDTHRLARVLERVRGDFVTIADDLRGALRPSREPRRILLTLLALTLIAAAVRLVQATAPMSYDESITWIFFSSRSPLDIWTDYTIPNNHVLHSLLVHFARLLFGHSELAVRLPALLAGIALVPATTLLTARLSSWDAGLLAGALVAAAPPLVEYSAQARGYTLVALFTVIAFYFMLVARDTRAIGAWAVVAIMLALALFTIPTALGAVIMLVLWAVLAERRNPTFRRAILVSVGVAIGLAGVLYLPTAYVSGIRALVANGYVRPLRLTEIGPALLELGRSMRTCWAGALPSSAAFVLLATVLVGAIAPWNHRRPGMQLFAAVCGSLAVVLALFRVVPPARTLLHVLPLLAAVAGFGTYEMLRRLPAGLRLIRWIAPLAIVVGWGAMYFAHEQVRGNAVTTGGYRDPGRNGVRCCAEGYFADAPDVAVWASRMTDARRPLVADDRSGLCETTRFYLDRAGLPMSRLHPYHAPAGLSQLGRYETVYLLVRKPPAAVSTTSAVADRLRVTEEALSSAFRPPEVIAMFRTSQILRLVPLPAERDAAMSGPRVDLFAYPR